MEALKNHWEKLSPNAKRNVSWGAALTFLAFVLFPFISGGQTKARAEEASVGARSVLTDDNLHGQSIDTISAQIRDMRRENAELKSSVQGLTDELKRQKNRKETAPGSVDPGQVERIVTRQVRDRMKQMQQDVTSLRKDLKKSEQKYAQAVAAAGTTGQRTTATDVFGSASSSSDIWATQPKPVVAEDKPARGEKGEDLPKLAIKTVSSDAASDEADTSDKFNNVDFYIPAGTMIPGVLLTGLDAPTGQKASSEPHPVLMRVKKSAILPNRYRQDFRECFILGSGYGELSSERAMVRSETLSCVDNDGNVLEKPVKMYAVGEDSKVGIRGTVVRKDGQLLAAALGSGFLEGVAAAFNKVPVPTIQTDNVTGQVPYQDVYSSDTLQSGFSQGAGTALSRLSEYYMDLADEIFPVIEIAAGRQVTFVVTVGSDTKPTLAGQGKTGSDS